MSFRTVLRGEVSGTPVAGAEGTDWAHSLLYNTGPALGCCESCSWCQLHFYWWSVTSKASPACLREGMLPSRGAMCPGHWGVPWDLEPAALMLSGIFLL